MCMVYGGQDVAAVVLTTSWFFYYYVKNKDWMRTMINPTQDSTRQQ